MDNSYFAHLHTHSEFSILDGLSRVTDIVDKAKSLGHGSVAITDHGHMGNVPEFYSYAKKQGINPIIGEEFYIVPDASVHDKEKRYFHIVLLARNEAGYHVLSDLSTQASNGDRFYYKPRIDWNLLSEYSGKFDDIIALSGCLNGEIPWNLNNGKPKRAEKILRLYRALFPHFYLEFQKHATQHDSFEVDELNANKELLRLGRKYDVPLVVTADSHYTEEEDCHYHEVLLAMQTKTTLDDEKRFKFNGSGYHIRSVEEMRGLFPKLWPEFRRSIRGITKSVFIDIPDLNQTVWHMPDSGIKGDPAEYFSRVTNKALRRKVRQGLVAKKDYPRYKKQLDYEEDIINASNFAENFIITEDYVGWARDSDIFVGYGRGSMAAVMGYWLMDIGTIDPIKFDLMFERAINPARPSIPDFDIDFDVAGRGKVIQYLRDKYGKDNVELMGTFGRMKPRAVLQRVMRVLGFQYTDILKYTKMLPESVEIDNSKSSADFREVMESFDPELGELLDDYPEIAEYCLKFQGLIFSMGTHASGVIITDEKKPLREHVPHIYVKEAGNLVTQYDMNGMKKLGFVKFDILGLKTLDKVRDTLNMVGRFKEFIHFPEGFDLEDKKVFATIASGHLKGIFQLEGYANRMAVAKVGKIESFEDIVSIISIARPGVSKFIPQFAHNKHHPEDIEYIDERLAPILNRSYGVVLLQEQIMEIARVFAAYDNAQLDDIKETIKAKNPAKFKEMKPLFLKACRDNGVKKSTRKHLWALIEDAAGYLYNRAHAVSYAVVTYLTAYLKTYYRNEWFVSMLNHASFDEYKEIVAEARSMDLVILPVDIRKSEVEFKIVGKNKIRYGFSNIKGIGVKMGQRIVALREEKGKKLSLEDIQGINIGTYKHLLNAGALARYKVVRVTHENEVHYHGVALKTDPLREYRDVFEEYVFNKKNQRKIDRGAKGVVIGGVVSKWNAIKTKNDQDMAFSEITLNDKHFSLVIFPQMMPFYEPRLRRGNIVLLIATKQEGRESYVPEEVEVLNE